MFHTKKTKKILAACMSIILVTTLLSGIPFLPEWNKNSHVKAATTLQNPRTDSNGVVTYDCVYFGNYPQSDASGQTKDPIKWRVLSVNGNDAFLVADQNLDVQRYNDTYKSVTWSTCTMRSWLNGYGSDSNVCAKDYSSNNFIDRAFTAEEQSAIRTTVVENADNPYYGTDGGETTNDKVFLLSYDEVTNPAYGFSSDYEEYDNARKRTNTAYVAAGRTIGSGWMNSEGTTNLWWLRSPGSNADYAMSVNGHGWVNRFGDFVGSSNSCGLPGFAFESFIF